MSTRLDPEVREVTVRAGTGDDRVTVVIWLVAVDGRLFVRSFLGEDGRWYRAALAHPEVGLASGSDAWDFTAVPVTDPEVLLAVSDAYRSKYADMGPWLYAMVASDVEAATLRLDPR